MSDSESEQYESAGEEIDNKNAVEEKFETPSKTLPKVAKDTTNLSSQTSSKVPKTDHDEVNKNVALPGNEEKKDSLDTKTKSADGWDLDDWDVDVTEEDTKTENLETNKDQWNDFDDCKEPTKTVSEEVDTSTKAQAKDESDNSQKQSSWVWKPWGGVVSLLSTATEGVTTLSSQVSSVIEKSMGVPDPEEMAKLNAQTAKDKQQAGEIEETVLPSFGSIVTGVTSIGNKVITGGLDTLEEIGKKTMNILQENDPLLLNKRKLLGLENEKPNLSQVLREAKEKSDEIEKNLKQIQKKSYKRRLHFEILFDNYYGLVHLEALEMLSKQSKLKLQSLLEPLTGNARTELEETLNEVKELCELGYMENDENDGLYDVEELKPKLMNSIEDLGVDIDFNELLKCWQENIEWLSQNSEANATEIYEHGLRCLAETCALAMLKLHKIAEMLMIKEHHSTANEADALVQLTNILCFHLNGVANRFGSKLNSLNPTEEINAMITSLFVEVFNSTSYVQSAFQLFIPILQIGAA